MRHFIEVCQFEHLERSWEACPHAVGKSKPLFRYYTKIVKTLKLDIFIENLPDFELSHIWMI